METGLPLLDYPLTAGAKEYTTSLEAAEQIEKSGRAEILRMKVLGWFVDGNEGTADECAAALNENHLSIRPRLSELHAAYWIEPTGERRKSLAGGRSAHVWRKVRP